jgi:hypothetical protein
MGRVRKEDQGCRMPETEIHVAINCMSISRSTAPGLYGRRGKHSATRDPMNRRASVTGAPQPVCVR